MKKPIGQTKDAGFQFGIRKTFPLSADKVWDFMFSDKGLNIWLGELVNEIEINKSFHTKDGIEGYVRVFEPYSHMRINWKKKTWENMSTVQVRVIGNEDKTTISFHQEKLLNAEQRGEMKAYWNKKISKISDALNEPGL